jgi:hypothetical protein
MSGLGATAVVILPPSPQDELPDRLPLDPRRAVTQRRVIVGGDAMRARMDGEDVRIRNDVVVDEEQDGV